MYSNTNILMEIDCGNSSAKWRLVSKSDVVARGVFSYDNDFSILLGSLPLAVEELAGCRVVSVAPETVRLSLEQSWGALSSAPIQFAVVEKECAGVRCGYDDVQQMGADRWSALLGATKLVEGACIVVDAGTALTVDVLDADYQHQGGYILPGLEMMLTALKEKTAIPSERIPALDRLGNIQPGRETRAAVANAATLSCSSFISEVVAMSDSGTKLILTGGLSDVLASVLKGPIIRAPELVLDGLALLVPMEVKE